LRATSCRSNDDIAFASNDLTDVRLHRSDNLSSITLWAPRLLTLNVQACYSLEDIVILEDHVLSAGLPADFAPTRFQLLTLNANLPPLLKASLLAHPRVAFGCGSDSDGEDLFGGHPAGGFLGAMPPGAGGMFGGMDAGGNLFEAMNPMEAMMGQLHGFMAGDGPMGPFGGVMGGEDGDEEDFLEVEGGGAEDALRMLFTEMAAAQMLGEDLFGEEEEDSEWETTDDEHSDTGDSGGDSDVGDSLEIIRNMAEPGNTVTITEIIDE